jgi:hypothetical protein
MEINFGSDQRNTIADVLWKIQDFDQAKDLAYNYGTDGVIVLHMMVAEFLDEYCEVDLADQYLSIFKQS